MSESNDSAAVAEASVAAAPARVAAGDPAVETRLGAAIVVGTAAAIAAAAAWAVVTVTTHYQLGLMAIAVGALVGIAVQRVGRSGAPVLGVAGAVLAGLGCVLGNLFAQAGFAAQQTSLSLAGALGLVLTPSVAARALSQAFDGMGILFCAIAIYEGYKFARKVPKG
jgi:hypothetical protein